MKYMMFLITTWLIASTCYAQGSWDIDYVEIDSLSSDYLHIPIKLDFKHTWTKRNKPPKRHIRDYVTPEDTAYLLINEVKTGFVERRAIYVDHGSFDEQFLEIESPRISLSKRIYDTEILHIEENRINLRAVVQSYIIRNGKIKEELESETITFWIHKDKLDGIMIEI